MRGACNGVVVGSEDAAARAGQGSTIDAYDWTKGGFVISSILVVFRL